MNTDDTKKSREGIHLYYITSISLTLTHVQQRPEISSNFFINIFRTLVLLPYFSHFQHHLSFYNHLETTFPNIQHGRKQKETTVGQLSILLKKQNGCQALCRTAEGKEQYAYTRPFREKPESDITKVLKTEDTSPQILKLMLLSKVNKNKTYITI